MIAPRPVLDFRTKARAVGKKPGLCEGERPGLCKDKTNEAKMTIHIHQDDLPADIDLGDMVAIDTETCLLYTSPSPRDGLLSRMPSSA